ncbi:hypothetical protein NDU88_006079 [Pleurodeles waltl]|uniref:Secreted protein n=1 Tax=Pleurodeles waltl TaxID=8319 RepID=A0AAV7UKW2_PLEWA|nr:hypothetical protein NDU88_006079 [Pleurodeles waltl]
MSWGWRQLTAALMRSMCCSLASPSCEPGLPQKRVTCGRAVAGHAQCRLPGVLCQERSCTEYRGCTRDLPLQSIDWSAE